MSSSEDGSHKVMYRLHPGEDAMCYQHYKIHAEAEQAADWLRINGFHFCQLQGGLDVAGAEVWVE